MKTFFKYFFVFCISLLCVAFISNGCKHNRSKRLYVERILASKNLTLEHSHNADILAESVQAMDRLYPQSRDWKVAPIGTRGYIATCVFEKENELFLWTESYMTISNDRDRQTRIILINSKKEKQNDSRL